MKSNFSYDELRDIFDSKLGSGQGSICEFTIPDQGEPLREANVSNTPTPFIPPLLCGLNEPIYPNVPITHDPCKDLLNVATSFAEDQFELYLDSLRNVFDTAYMNKCLGAKKFETFTALYNTSEYHYTLYYYDQAGNLVKTVPPAGVHPNYSSSWLNTAVPNARATGAKLTPTHTLTTNYRYNTLNQVISQATPDAGTSKFWYDRLGRLVVSQNAKQAEEINNHIQYSYTLYDELGRITEVGEKPKHNAAAPMTQIISQDEFGTTGLRTWLSTPLEVKRELTRTVYDEPWPPFCGTIPDQTIFCPKNLRNRVSYTYVKAIDDSNPDYPWDAATFYSYDIHGNVDTLLQDFKIGAMSDAGNRFKKIVYEYDLISGKVNAVNYQPNQTDAFYHRYSYDAENRLTTAETSSDKLYWERDAWYSYYRHGPLALVVLGQNQVQGIDYAYTLQGWLKGINSTSVGDGMFDMGEDGKTGSSNSNIARDAYGLSLNYFAGDYKPINNTVTPFASIGVANDLFNGNIKSMIVNIPKLGDAIIYGYGYDQLNRLVAMDAYKGLNNATNSFTPITIDDYKERLSYDANGNIKTYLRNGTTTGGTPLAMDNMVYSYKLNTNQLDHVNDAVPATNYSIDIDNQDTLNYTYDPIGNLTKDVAEGISNIDWNVYGKISSITKSNGTNISYTYDASGNRISKTVTTNNTAQTTFYVRDASGNVMSVYEKKSSLNGGDLTQTEKHIYGSSRLGMNTFAINVEQPLPNTGTTQFWRGFTFYELSNHLGNVLVTVSDKRLQHSSNNTSVDYFMADVINAQDYAPGGMLLPGRKYQAGSSSYRFGFGGQEKSDDIKGEGNSYTAEYWEYDSRLVRRWNVDPITKPWESPYTAFSNNPINLIDPFGLNSEDPKPKYKQLENVTVIGYRKKGSNNSKKKEKQPNINSKDFMVFTPPRVGLDGVNIPHNSGGGLAQNVGRFNLPVNSASSNNSTSFNFADVLQKVGFAAEHGEKVLAMAGKGGPAKAVGTAATILTGVSLVNNAVHKNWMGVFVDASDITLSNIAKSSPYYYAGKTLVWTFTSDFTMSNAYRAWDDERKVLINNFHYYRQIGDEAGVEKIQKKLIIIERGQAEIRKQLQASE